MTKLARIIRKTKFFRRHVDDKNKQTELCRVQKLTINEVRKKTGLGVGTIYRYLHTFEEENPKLVEQMKKQGPNIIPEDYKKLQEEVLRLKCELKREKLRADFYEEMVAFGKEVYGIDLKKAGTK